MKKEATSSKFEPIGQRERLDRSSKAEVSRSIWVALMVEKKTKANTRVDTLELTPNSVKRGGSRVNAYVSCGR